MICVRRSFTRARSWVQAIQQPNAFLEDCEIDRMEDKGVRMKDGTLHELDVIVMCTGFKVDRFVRPMKVRGEGNRDLDEVWKDGPFAYYAVTVPHFPNMLLFNGPTGPVGNFSLIDIAEHQWRYFDQLIDLVRGGECTSFAPTDAALEDYLSRRAEQAKKTVFASGSKSWYLDNNGVPAVWPWSFAYFEEVMAKPCREDYSISK